MADAPMDVVAAVGIATCWGLWALVWLVGALYNASRGPATRTRAPFGSATVLGFVVVWAILGAVSFTDWRFPVVSAAWVRLVGLVVLVGSLLFTLWARRALGVMWSSAPMVKSEHALRTDGPYRITRHPIYTGMLGMLLGTSLLAELGRGAVLLPVGLVVFEIKIWFEERLMVAAFPQEYPRYRQQVPQLVPGLRLHRPKRERHGVT